MAKDNIEVEIKISVNKKVFEKVKRFLNKNAKFTGSSQEIDKYFNSPHRNFLAKAHPSEYLRVRISNNKGSFTYKNVYLDKKGERKYSDEFESDVVNPNQVIKILEALSFDNFITIEKLRETYVYKNKFEFALDKVKGLGYFVEIEALRDFGGVDATRREILTFVRKLGMNKTKKDEGYVIQMMKKKGLF